MVEKEPRLSDDPSVRSLMAALDAAKEQAALVHRGTDPESLAKREEYYEQILRKRVLPLHDGYRLQSDLNGESGTNHQATGRAEPDI